MKLLLVLMSALALANAGPSGMLMDHTKDMEWYVTTEGDDCGTLPSEDQIMTGSYKKAACSAADAAAMDRVCLCKKPSPKMMEEMEAKGKNMDHLHPDTGFAPYCGKCMDPCGLKWEMKKSKKEMEMERAMMQETMEQGAPSGLPKTVDSLVKVALGTLEKDMKHEKDKEMQMQMIRYMKDTTWFVTEEGDDCGSTPAEDQIMMGDPMMDTCTVAEAGDMDEVCICKKPPAEVLEAMVAMGKTPGEANSETGYIPYCGQCHDPCALQWMMDMPKKDMDMSMEGEGMMMEGGESMMSMEEEEDTSEELPVMVEPLLKMALDILEKEMMAAADNDH